MSTKLFCDGCGSELAPLSSRPRAGIKTVVVEGSPVSSLTGVSPSVPRSKFHWCKICTEIAFEAVLAAQSA